MSANHELPTVSFDGPTPEAGVRPALPILIGRYRVTRLLGHGGFGVVYQAHDEQLHRVVAIKVPHPRLFEQARCIGDTLTEARIVANLDHPHIVPVHDVGSCPEFPAFIVSKYIDGISLSAAITNRKFTPDEVAMLLAAVADALQYAHSRGLVHRDVKPGNVLLDRDNVPYLTDFGLALREERYGQFEGAMYGTPFYMSPEQARGEGHLVDGRADIFSLGVIMYELLTGMRPFLGRTAEDVLRAVITLDPRPPRQKNDHIPRELERICLQALAKRASERYSTAKDLEDDLRHYLASQSAGVPPHANQVAAATDSPAHPKSTEPHSSPSSRFTPVIVPKGLRAFDESDREFFLSLLPGPFDREGLPQSLRFWKARLEEVNPTNPLRVGVVYGPSGCGKSSLIRAGLLPRLGASLHTIVVTATAHQTEKRILDELRFAVPQPVSGLVDAMQRLRRSGGEGRRVLIVIDQFEQWLHANQPGSECELVEALRQCDGLHVSCLLIVRDDFWMSVHRFFRELDVRLAEHENCVAVDLFDTRHARRVLHAFGYAYGALPGRTDELTADQTDFLDQAIGELAENDRVICVRLALFAQMVRNRPWTPATLQAVGGARGVGIRFLEDTLGTSSAPLSYRVHQTAVREVLRALLPPSGTDIKACTRTASELSTAAGCSAQSPEFQQLIAILEEETRLITPVDSHQADEQQDDAHSQVDDPAYQLTHDYLVPSIREWLARKQRETWVGRCELLLEERTSLWSSHHEDKQLPSLRETIQILVGTQSAHWTPAQARMMRQARGVHGRRWSILTAIVACVFVGVWIWQHEAEQASRRSTADTLVDRLMVADIDHVAPVLKDLAADRELTAARLAGIASDPNTTQAGKWRAELALVPSDRRRMALLLQSVWDTDPRVVRVVRDWLKTEAPPSADDLWNLAAPAGTTPARRLRLAAFMAEFDPGSKSKWDSIAADVTTALLTDASLEVDDWADLLYPARERLTPYLAQQFLSAAAKSAPRITAAQVLSKLGTTELLCTLILEADATQFSKFILALSRDARTAVKLLKPVLTQSPRPSTPGLRPLLGDRLRHVRRQCLAVCALLRLGQGDVVWPLLEASPDCTLRTELLLTVSELEVPYEILLQAETRLRDPVARQAIWMMLASYQPSLSPSQRADLVRLLIIRSAEVPQLVERSGIEWCMKRVGTPEECQLLQTAPRTPPADWSVNSQGQVFLKIRGPAEFRMGSPPDEPRREPSETQHRRRIEHSFAVSVHEVTAAQFLKFRAEMEFDPVVCPHRDCPAGSLSWLDAAAYCRWLSEQEHIPEDQMCYPAIDQIRANDGTNPGIVFPPDFLSRTGYRLPTEAEWEYVCRGNTTTRYYFGDDERHMSAFGWWIGNSEERTWPVGTLRPNLFGLFDLQGNVQEWCQDEHARDQAYPAEVNGQPVTSTTAEQHPVQRDSQRIFRGAAYRSPGRAFRSAQRYEYPVASPYSILGFRLARSLPATER